MAGLLELLRHLEGHKAPQRPAPQEVGALMLDGPHRLDIGGGHLLDPIERRQVAFDPLRLQTVDRPLTPQMTREGGITEDRPAPGMYEEEGSPGPPWLDGHQRGPGAQRFA